MEKIRFSFPNEKVAYLWPDHPFVLAGSIVLDDIISGIDSGESVCDLSNSISQKYNEDYNIVRTYVESINSAIYAVRAKSSSQGFIDGLSMATFNLTKACNLKCRHCYAAAAPEISPLNELTNNEIEVVIENLSKLVVYPPKLLIFSGGEPTLKMDRLIHAIKIAHKFGFNIRLNTNGLILSTELIEVLNKYEVLTQISIDGATPESHALLRGQLDSYKQAVESLNVLCKSGCRVRVSMTTHADNAKEIRDVFSLAINSGAEQFITSNLVVTGRAQNSGLRPLLLSQEFSLLYEIVKDDKQLQKMSKSCLLAETINAMRAGVKFINCGTGICTCCIDADGSMYPCINMTSDKFRIARATNKNLKDEWDNSIIISELRALSVDSINDKCPSCHFRYFCGAYCRGETLSAGGTLNTPYIRCSEWKRAIIKVIEILCNSPNLYLFEKDSLQEVMSRE